MYAKAYFYTFLFLFFVFVIFFSSMNSHSMDTRGSDGVKTWVCWFSSIKDTTCGTYGWSTSKDKAKKSALEKCEEYCKYQCDLDYCEKKLIKEKD